MSYRVLKFGGSSITAEGFNTILNRTIQLLSNNHKVVIVLSAISGTTDSLFRIVEGEDNLINEVYDKQLKLCEELGVDYGSIEILLNSLIETIYSEDYSINKKAKIISYGEKMATHILSSWLNTKNINYKLMDAPIFMGTSATRQDVDSKQFCSNGELSCNGELVKQLLERYDVMVTQGFVVSTSDGGLSLLTRSGSDTSASLIASNLGPNAKLEIWTDVDGVYSADPNKIDGARLINTISYDVCQELSAMGSKVLHPYCIKPCHEVGVPIYVRNTYNSDCIGTMIVDMPKIENRIYTVSVQKKVTVFYVESMSMWNNYGFVTDIFKSFSNCEIDINIITTSQFCVTTTTSETDMNKLNFVERELKVKGYNVKFISNCHIVSVIADDIVRHHRNKNIMEILEIVSPNDLHITHFSSNGMSLSLVVNQTISHDLVNRLHNVLFS